MSRSSISLPAVKGNYRRQLRTEGGLVAGSTSVSFIAESLSSIVNLVCPECGGAMGGRSQEFKCRGRCGKDWRLEWKRFQSREVVPFIGSHS